MKSLHVNEVANGWVIEEYEGDTIEQVRVVQSEVKLRPTEVSVALDDLVNCVRNIMSTWEDPDRDDPLAP